MNEVLCFPYAGATAAYYGWGDRPPFSVVAYPANAQTVEEVVENLLRTVAPRLSRPFAFFGHSMGAGIAFEFTRALRREGLPMPAALFVSAATAPQLRTTVHPEMTDEDVYQSLVRIHGAGAPEVALRALVMQYGPDARLHRRYVYREEPPLDVPIRVFGGLDDATVALPRLEAWREQTTLGFELRLFSGGHMFVDRNPQFLPALREAIRELLPD